MNEVTVKQRLPRDLLWIVGILSVWLSAQVAIEVGMLGVDSHAYWAAWQGEMYDGAPNTRDAYLYSPAFAQAIWPLAQLPWWVFGVVWAAASLAAMIWLVKVREWYVAIPLMLIGTHEMLSGNVNWLMALVVVFGLRYPWVWAFPFLTKLTPCLGPVWFLARFEWRNLSISLSSIAAIAAVSWSVSPGLWQDWIGFLVEHARSADEQVGGTMVAPLVVRIPFAVALVVWGARTDRVWVLPVGMLLVSPVSGVGQFTLLLALPRLMQQHATAREMKPATQALPDSPTIHDRV